MIGRMWRLNSTTAGRSSGRGPAAPNAAADRAKKAGRQPVRIIGFTRGDRYQAEPERRAQGASEKLILAARLPVALSRRAFPPGVRFADAVRGIQGKTSRSGVLTRRLQSRRPTSDHATTLRPTARRR